MKFSLALLSAIAVARAAYVPSSEPWSTLTPSGTYSGATTDYSHSFGIQIVTASTSASSAATASASAVEKRAVEQIGDGQIQEQTSVTLSTPTPTTTAASVVNQIGDGQIQHQTAETSSSKTTVASVVNQIGDGQIQHQTAETSSSKTTAASVVNQIGDGQIQHQTASTSSASVVNQISDGQIQHQSASTSTTTGTGAAQISDGQVQATGTASSESGIDTDYPVACLTSDSLAMTLNSSMLTDSKGRVGAIVSNYQFQFDGPPPQSGSIYAAGWSITDDGYLALGDTIDFYQCKSGDFYNLYYKSIGSQCELVYLEVVNFIDC